MQQQTEIEALSSALATLAPLHGPRGLQALRLALRTLLTDEPGPAAMINARADLAQPAPVRPVSTFATSNEAAKSDTPKPAARTTLDPRGQAHLAPHSGWPELRRQVVEAVETRGTTRAALAAAVGLSPRSLRNLLAPSGSGHRPGAGTVQRLRHWLDTPPAAMNLSSSEVQTAGAAEVPAPAATFRHAGNGTATGADVITGAGAAVAR